MSNSSHDRSTESFFGDVISTYTRAQAIEDGVLIDAGNIAQEAGFQWPVAVTSAVWGRLRGLVRERQRQAGTSGRVRPLMGCALHGVPCCPNPLRFR